MPLRTELDELFSDCSKDRVSVETMCRRCGRKSKARVPWVLIDAHTAHEDARDEDGWDGFLLGRVIACRKCKAIDDYAITSWSKVALVLLAASAEEGARAGLKPSTGVRFGVGTLHDGTVLHRASRALAMLRARAEAHPSSGEAWRRLGNGCNHYGCQEEAERAWRRAIEVDDEEFEAAFSLTQHYFADLRAEAWEVLQLAIERLPRARNLDADWRRRAGSVLAGYLADAVRISDEPIALEAAWTDGRIGKNALVRISSVDLHEVRDWERLGAFIGSPNVHALRLGQSLPEDEYPQLQALLDDMLPEYTPSQPFVRVSPKAGRNDPCSCGSGKKFKRCCLAASSAERRAS
jgi:hypothetical protein